MTTNEAVQVRIERLAQDVHQMILAKRALIEQAEGKITLEIYPKGVGYDFKLNITTR